MGGKGLQKMNFWRLIRVVTQKKWIILGVMGVTLLVIAIAAPKPRVVYEATAAVSPSPQAMLGGMGTTVKDGDYASRPDRNVILGTLINLAESSEVFEEAMAFVAKPLDQQQDSMAALGKSFQRPLQQVNRVEVDPGVVVTYATYRKDVLQIAPVVNPAIGDGGTTTDVIRITVRLRDGDAAPYVANAIAYAFCNIYQEKNRTATDQYIGFLQTSKESARKELNELRNQIMSYKRGNRVVSVDAETSSALSSLAEYENVRSTAESAVREAEAALQDIDSQLRAQPLVTRDRLPSEMNPNVKKLQEELAAAEAELRLLAQRYKPAHDVYKAAEARIRVLKDRIEKEGQTYSPAAVNEIHKDLVKKRSEARYALATARAKLATASASVARAQTRISSLTEAEPRLAELTTDYTQADNNYRLLSDKLAQAQIAEKELQRNGSIIPYGWARGAEGPIIEGPSRKALLVYGLVLSLVMGVALVVWLDSIDNKMRNAGDVEKLLELPAIGLTPQLTARDGVLPKLTHIYPLSASAESYRILRTNILFALRDNPFKTLMVATARPGQGGTTTICNLAIALAQVGKRIVLIDADMRRPSLHKFFGVPNEAGLSTLLQGEGSLTDAFQKTDIDNLIVIPAGPQPLNPSELIASDAMRDLVKRLEDHCDLVLFDTPSAIVFSDAPMLASWVDAVVMVVSANQAPRGTERETRDLLRRAKANILGVVVNRMAPENVDSCYFYSHYYSDSAVHPPDTALGSGNGRRGDTEVAENRTRAIPAAVASKAAGEADAAAEQEAQGGDGDNPFPD